MINYAYCFSLSQSSQISGTPTKLIAEETKNDRLDKPVPVETKLDHVMEEVEEEPAEKRQSPSE